MSQESHASPALYGKLAVVLCVITAIEWVIFKVESWREQTLFIVPALVVLSILKFVLVAGWYMHLKYDPSILTKIFTFCIFFTIFIFTITYLSLLRIGA